MRIRSILIQTGQTPDKTLKLTTEKSVRAAAALLGDKGVGFASVVDPDGSLVGVVSERDIVRLIGEGGDLERPVRDIMTPDPVTVAETDEVETAIERMSAHHCRHLPVLNGRSLVGVVSVRDIIAHLQNTASDQERALIFAKMAIA